MYKGTSRLSGDGALIYPSPFYYKIAIIMPWLDLTKYNQNPEPIAYCSLLTTEQEYENFWVSQMEQPNFENTKARSAMGGLNYTGKFGLMSQTIGLPYDCNSGVMLKMLGWEANKNFSMDKFAFMTRFLSTGFSSANLRENNTGFAFDVKREYGSVQLISQNNWHMTMPMAASNCTPYEVYRLVLGQYNAYSDIYFTVMLRGGNILNINTDSGRFASNNYLSVGSFMGTQTADKIPYHSLLTVNGVSCAAWRKVYAHDDPKGNGFANCITHVLDHKATAYWYVSLNLAFNRFR